jgi:thioredoxin 1
VTFTIAKATPTLLVTDAGGPYNGAAFAAKVRLTGVSRSAVARLEGVTPTVTYCHGTDCSSKAPTQAGTYTVEADFAGSTDYVAVQSPTITFTIAPGIVQVNTADFQRQVIQSAVPVLVSFSAAWCYWCQQELPILKTIAKDRPDVKVVEINVDNNPALVRQYGVDAIPRLLVFRNGQKVNDTLGLHTEDEILAMLS